jgi:S-DNA-T family DNA segregation ATPase FtsK/SpoIIIE
LLVCAIGVILFGVALGMLRGSAVSGLPAGWGGALGLAGANGIEAALALIRNPSVEGPLRLTLLPLFAIIGLALTWISLALRPEEKGWFANLFARDPRPAAAAPRKTREERTSANAAPPRSRPAVAVSEPPRPIASGRKGEGGRRGRSGVQASLALGDDYVLPG